MFVIGPSPAIGLRQMPLRQAAIDSVPSIPPASNACIARPDLALCYPTGPSGGFPNEPRYLPDARRDRPEADQQECDFWRNEPNQKANELNDPMRAQGTGLGDEMTAALLHKSIVGAPARSP